VRRGGGKGNVAALASEEERRALSGKGEIRKKLVLFIDSHTV